MDRKVVRSVIGTTSSPMKAPMLSHPSLNYVSHSGVTVAYRSLAPGLAALSKAEVVHSQIAM